MINKPSLCDGFFCSKKGRLMKAKHIIIIAALFAFCAVAIGALGAHGLKNHLSTTALAWVTTAATYQMYHALALLAVAALLLKFGKQKSLLFVSYSFCVGIILFSGSLYLLAFSEVSGFTHLKSYLVYLTPLGGFALLLGWIGLIFAAVSLPVNSATE
ncbi:MAG: uncharacterized membrane protein YgdD (TMEM256/DUF423 family) [Oceanospirillaceae bacterium]